MVDSLEFKIPFHGQRFYTHKWKFYGGLRYEVAVSIIGAECVWINGPYEPGIWNDILIFRNSLMSMLGVGERVEADDGYRGEAPQHVKCPKSIGHHAICAEMQSWVQH